MECQHCAKYTSGITNTKNLILPILYQVCTYKFIVTFQENMKRLLYLSLTLCTSLIVNGRPENLGIDAKGNCEVIEVASGQKKPCEAEFKFENKTYYGCTTVGGDNLAPWCSTKVNPITKEHIVGQSNYGDCPTDGSCLTEEEGEKFYNELRENTENMKSK